MSERAKKEAALGIIGGKPLKEWADAPAGEFAKTVRKTGVDPNFGLRAARGDDDELKEWRVVVHYTYQPEREYAKKEYVVEAADAEAAQEIAEEEWEEDVDLEGDEPEIDDVEDAEEIEK